MSVLRTILVIVSTAVASACGDPRPPAGEVTAYLETAATWAPTEAETARSIDRIFKSQFIDEPAIRTELAGIRPRVARHLDRIGSQRPADRMLSNIHDTYEETWRDLGSSIDLLDSALARHDTTALSEARAGLMRWRRGIADVASRIKLLQ